MEKIKEIKFYKDEAKGIIDPTLFSNKAEELAITIATEGKRHKKNKVHQIRKFFDEVQRLKAEYEAGEPWDNIYPLVNMLNAKVTYALGRRDLITEDFRDFIKSSISQIKKPEHLKVFASFFEAFMGYYKYYREKEDKNAAH